MKTTILHLSKTLLFERVALVTAYHGVRNDGTPCYERVAIVEPDRPWLDTTLCHALQRVRCLFAPFLWESTTDDTPALCFDLVLRVPPSVTPSHLDRWRILCYEYLEAAALVEWFSISAPTMAVPWQTQRDTSWQQLSTSIKFHHRRPRTRLPPI